MERARPDGHDRGAENDYVKIEHPSSGQRLAGRGGARARGQAGDRYTANSCEQQAFVYGALGCAYQSLGDFGKAIEYRAQCLAIAKMGDRAVEGQACWNLGNAYTSQGDFGKAVEYHTQDLALCPESCF
jgi:tetratricopeptide (TPR) repeat protein